MDKNTFIIVLIVILVIFYTFKIHENYFSDSYDITPRITTDMDWKGAMLSRLPYYTNNLVNPPADVLSEIQELQKYQPITDNKTNTTWVSDNMNLLNSSNLSNLSNLSTNFDDPNNKEGFEEFTTMNPYISD